MCSAVAKHYYDSISIFTFLFSRMSFCKPAVRLTFIRTPCGHQQITLSNKTNRQSKSHSVQTLFLHFNDLRDLITGLKCNQQTSKLMFTVTFWEASGPDAPASSHLIDYDLLASRGMDSHANFIRIDAHPLQNRWKIAFPHLRCMIRRWDGDEWRNNPNSLYKIKTMERLEM